MLKNNDWDLYNRFNNLWSFVLAFLPYFWFLIFFVLCFFVILNFKKTNKGYKYSSLIILFSIFFSSIIFGFVFYKIGFGNKINEIFIKNEIYQNIIEKPKCSAWNNPEKGLLIGVINSTLNNNIFYLLDIDAVDWKIEATNLGDDEKVDIIIGKKIKIIGERIDHNNFRALEIREACGCGCLDKINNCSDCANKKKGCSCSERR
jgi:hypothetical protein